VSRLITLSPLKWITPHFWLREKEAKTSDRLVKFYFYLEDGGSMLFMYAVVHPQIHMVLQHERLKSMF
jgi:hypothetical protein